MKLKTFKTEKPLELVLDGYSHRTWNDPKIIVKFANYNIVSKKLVDNNYYRIEIEQPKNYKDLTEFSNLILNVRTQKGLTQKQVADMLGIGIRLYQSWEYSEFKPSAYYLVRLIKVLELDIDLLEKALQE